MRDATPADHPAVVAVLLAAYGSYRGLVPAAAWAAYEAELGDAEGWGGSGELVVAEEGGKVVGTVTFYADSAADDHGLPPGGAAFRRLAVLPEARGKGAGEELVRECIRRARQRRAPWLGLHTAAFMTSAVRIYAALGFVRRPDLDFDPGAHYAGSSDPDLRGLAYVLVLSPEDGPLATQS